MPIPNIESLLEPVSADAPCGADMEYDPAFLELDRLSESKPEQQMGDHIVPAQEPDWKEVGNRALALLAKTKDLRIAVRLTRARLYTEGFAGFADGITVTKGIVEKFWDGFYPKPDPDEPDDPTFRVNILMSLCDGGSFIDRIRVTPLVAARSFGRFSLRDIAVATGELPPPPDTEAPKTSAIDGAFTECPLPELEATAASLRSAQESLAAIEAFVAEKVGAANGTNFAKLVEVLRAAEKIVAGHLARRGVVTAGAEAGAEGGAAGEAGGGPAISGEIKSREDVVRVLDKICLYYERYEPSSPIPLLLQRSKRLVSASFMDIVRDLAPDGLPQVENLRGKDESQSS
jgi:type VI secretion system protein ImpA